MALPDKPALLAWPRLFCLAWKPGSQWRHHHCLLQRVCLPGCEAGWAAAAADPRAPAGGEPLKPSVKASTSGRSEPSSSNSNAANACSTSSLWGQARQPALAASAGGAPPLPAPAAGCDDQQTSLLAAGKLHGKPSGSKPLGQNQGESSRGCEACEAAAQLLFERAEKAKASSCGKQLRGCQRAAGFKRHPACFTFIAKSSSQMHAQLKWLHQEPAPTSRVACSCWRAAQPEAQRARPGFGCGDAARWLKGEHANSHCSWAKVSNAMRSASQSTLAPEGRPGADSG